MTLPLWRVFGQNLAIFACFWAFSVIFLAVTAINMLTLGIGRACIFHGHIPSWFEAVLAFAMLQLWTRGPQKWVIFGSKSGHNGRVGLVWGRDPLWELFSTSDHINTNRKTWFRAVLAPAILPACAWGGQKWLILRSKSGHNGRVTQGPWNQRGNSWTPQITSISIGKHDLGQLWPLPSIPRVHGGVKNGSFWGQNQVTMAGSSRDPGIIMKTLERLKSHLY